MTPGRRQFLETMIARLEPRIAWHRRVAPDCVPVIADVLERMVARDRAELAAIAPAPAPAPAPVPLISGRIAHRTTRWEGGFGLPDMVPDPDTWTALERARHAHNAAIYAAAGPGHATLARIHATLAVGEQPDAPDRQPDSAGGQPEAPIRKPRRWRETWTGPAMPPPEPALFVAGEQMGFAL